MAFLAAAAPVLGLVGSVIGAVGAVQQGSAQAAQARYEAQVNANNAIIAQQNAQYAIQAGEAASYQTGLRERAKAGAITAGIAANNIDVNVGSAAEARETQAELGQLSTETTRANAALQAYGYRTQATSFTAQQRLLQAEAPQDIAGGFLRGAGTLLAGASNFPTKWGALFPSAAPTTGDA
jgi:hypothetical protein